MSTPQRLYQILEGASRQVYQDDVVVCLIPTTRFATDIMKKGGYKQFQFPVPADGDDPDGPTIDITAMLLTLSSPPKIPGLGYTFGRNRKADVRIKFEEFKDFHFRIFFDATFGILKFSDEARPAGIYFHNHDTSTFGRNLENLPLDSRFQIGEKGDQLIFGGFIPGTEAHQKRRREYLTSLNAHFETVSHALSPPNDCRTVRGYQNWAHVKNSQFQVYKPETKTMLAGKFRRNLGDQYWGDKPPPRPDPSLQHEYETLLALKHEYIIRVEDLFSTRDLRPATGEIMTVLVTEFCLHGDLSRHNLKDRKHLECMRQISEGLCHIHSQNIIHNSLTPENILVYTMEPLHIKISGFSESRVDTRIFDSWVEKTVCYSQERARRFRLDHRTGVNIDQSPGDGITDEMIIKVHKAFPVQKWKRNNIYDAPEVADILVTTAVDIWALGLIHLRRYCDIDIETIYLSCQAEFKPFYSELSTYDSRDLQAFGLLNVLPAHRPTATAARDKFVSLINALKPESTGDQENFGSRSPETTPGQSMHETTSPAPYSQTGSDPYGVLSPSPGPRCGYHPDDWEGAIIKSEDDELKFRFRSPGALQIESLTASLFRGTPNVPQNDNRLRSSRASNRPGSETAGTSRVRRSTAIIETGLLGSREGSLGSAGKYSNTTTESRQPSDNYFEQSTFEDSQLKRPFPDDDEGSKASKIYKMSSSDTET